MELADLCQIPIFILGLTSMWLVNCKNKWWIICSFFNQPFWYYSTYVHKQWGMFVLAIVHTGMLCKGYQVWFKENKQLENLEEIVESLES